MTEKMDSQREQPALRAVVSVDCLEFVSDIAPDARSGTVLLALGGKIETAMEPLERRARQLLGIAQVLELRSGEGLVVVAYLGHGVGRRGDREPLAVRRLLAADFVQRQIERHR